MRISRREQMVRIEAPAKINLFLEIIARRQDGYHELETFMATVGIYDTIEFYRTEESSIELTCRLGLRPGRRRAPADDAPEDLPAGGDNLVHRALVALQRASGCSEGARVRLHKRIPWQAGLGGGSTDAAAALWAANLGWKLGWSRPKMAEFSSQLGSDIPFFFWGGAAVCRGRGEQVAPVAAARRLPLVVVVPDRGLATPDVFRDAKVPPTPQSARAWESGWRDAVPTPSLPPLFNRLERPAEQIEPTVAAARRTLRAGGAQDVRMSGSGSSCFGICRSMHHARRVAARVRARGWNRTYVTSTVEA